jgi:hypothetical protein
MVSATKTPTSSAPSQDRPFTNCICRWSRMRARLSPPRVLLPHTCTQDGWFLQPKRRPARLPRKTVPSNCICRCSRMRAHISPPRVLLPHTCTQDGWFLQPKRRPARLPRRTVPLVSRTQVPSRYIGQGRVSEPSERELMLFIGTRFSNLNDDDDFYLLHRSGYTTLDRACT